MNNRHSQGARPTPVLMIPLRRCGSHALRLRLNFNSAFYSPYPLHIVDFMPLLPLYGDLADDEKYFQLILDVVGLQNANMVRWANVTFEPVAIFEALKDKPRSIHMVTWEMLLRAGEAHNASVVMDKSLDNVHYAEELLALFDNFLFLNVVRDPRSQVSSMNRAIIHDFDTALNALTWVKAHDTARRLAAAYPERVLTIRYEDFLTDQETVLRKICGFFNIDFLPAMLDVSRSAEAQKISHLSALWESNASAPVVANIAKFRQYLSNKEIETIETLAGDHMDYYGYERISAGKAEVTPALLAAAKERSDMKRKDAWSHLKNESYTDYHLRKFRADYLEMVKMRLHRGGSSTAARETMPIAVA